MLNRRWYAARADYFLIEEIVSKAFVCYRILGRVNTVYATSWVSRFSTHITDLYVVIDGLYTQTKQYLYITFIYAFKSI